MEVAPKFVSPRSMWVSKLTLRCVTIGFDVIALALAGTTEWIGFLMIGPPVLVSFCWCVAELIRNRRVGPTVLVMQNPPNGTLPPKGQMQPLPGGQVYFQVLPGANGLPQQQVYYVPVQAMPGGQVGPLQTVLSPPTPAVMAANALAEEQKMQGYA